MVHVASRGTAGARTPTSTIRRESKRPDRNNSLLHAREGSRLAAVRVPGNAGQMIGHVPVCPPSAPAPWACWPRLPRQAAGEAKQGYDDRRYLDRGRR